MMLFLIAAHICRPPAVAYYGDSLSRDMTVREIAAMERFAYCVCGPDGSVDWDPRPVHGRYRMHPSCNRDGWNGRGYALRARQGSGQ